MSTAHSAAHDKYDSLREKMNEDERKMADQIAALPSAQQELSLAMLICVSAVRSSALDNGQRNDLMCTALNFYASARGFAMLETVVEHAMRGGGDERALKQALGTALHALHDTRVEMAARIDVLAELLRPTEDVAR